MFLKFQRSASTEELSAELRNLEGIMKDLSAIRDLECWTKHRISERANRHGYWPITWWNSSSDHVMTSDKSGRTAPYHVITSDQSRRIGLYHVITSDQSRRIGLYHVMTSDQSRRIGLYQVMIQRMGPANRSDTNRSSLGMFWNVLRRNAGNPFSSLTMFYNDGALILLHWADPSTSWKIVL